MAIANREIGLGTIFYAKGIDELIRKIKLLRQVVIQLSDGPTKVAKSLNTLTTASNKATAAMKKQGDVSQTFNKQIGKVEGGIKRMAQAIKVTAAYSLAAKTLWGFTSGIQQGIKEIIDFDQALKNIQAVSGSTTAQLSVMEDVMLKIARTTKFSATEIGEGMVYIAQAGFDAGEAVDVVSASAALASGTLSSLQQTSDLLTTTLRAFQMESQRAGEAADIMAVAINYSKLDVEKLRTAFNYVGAAGYQVGLTLNEVAASMMVVANNGMRASTIGTGLRQMFSRMIAPSGKLKEAFEKYGISLDSINPKTVGYQKALGNLSKVIMKADGVTVDMTKAFELFGLRGAQSVAILAEAFASGKFQKALKSTYEVGVAAEMAAKQSEGLAFKLKNLSDNFGALAITLGKGGFTDLLKMVVDGFQSLLKVIIDISGSSIGNLILQIVTLTTALTSLGIALTLLGKILQLTILPSLKVFFGLIASHPYVAAFTVAISALIVVYKHFAGATEKATEAMKKQYEETKRTAGVLNFYGRLMTDQVEKMKKTSELTEEHLATLQRLKEDYPKLSGLIDNMKLSYEGYLGVLKAINDEERVKSVNNIQESVNIYKKYLDEMKKYEADFYSMGEFTGKGVAITPELQKRKDMYVQAAKDAKKAFEVIESTFYNYSSKRTGKSAENAKLMLKGFGLDADDIAKLSTTLIPQLESLDATIAAKKKSALEGSAEDEVNLTRQTQKKILDLKVRSAATERDRLIATHNKNLADIAEEEKAALVKNTSYNEKEKAAIASEYNKIRLEENRKFAIQMAGVEVDIAERAIKIEELQTKIMYEGKVVEALKAGVKLNTIREMEKQSEIDLAVKILEIRKTLYENVKNLYKGGKGGEEDQSKALNQVLQAELAIATGKKELAELTAKEITKSEDKELKARLKLVAKYSDEWMAIYKQMRDQNLITETEYEEALRRKTAATGTWLEQLKYGINESRKNIQSWGEYMIQIGEEIGVKLADGIGTAVADWVTGAKTMQEAFAALAQDTLAWLTKMIVRMLVLKAIEAGVNAIFPGAGTAFSAFVKHGGVRSSNVTRSVPSEMFVGAPRLHSGLIRSDEMPAILKKNESVLTPEQMKAMGGGKQIQITNSFAGATFLDQEQMRRTMAQVSTITAQVVVKAMGPDTVINAIQNDHPLRQVIQRGY